MVVREALGGAATRIMSGISAREDEEEELDGVGEDALLRFDRRSEESDLEEETGAPFVCLGPRKTADDSLGVSGDDVNETKRPVWSRTSGLGDKSEVVGL